ncbi:energy transducer TonB [Aquimarina sp. SS2-1]|uniref:energy transducer TonB n=1 Tax=Aquimarina besae TaxID=3342247 RepID=UPI00366CAF2B
MSNKHDANVRKSTLVNFQIGLIASLLCVYVGFEMYTSVSTIAPTYTGKTETNDNSFTIDVFKVEEQPKSKVTFKTKTVREPDWTKPKIVDNKVALQKLKKQLIGENDNNKSTAIPIDSIIEVGRDEKIVYPIDEVAVAPIYPGCEEYSDNKERIACFSSKIKTIVSRKFNADLGEEYGLKGLQRIHVQFQVDTDGMIKEVQVRAPHPVLEKEARRVVKKFSRMEPGKIGGEPVKVNYILPITFKVIN